jgi:hypothetical protein
MDGSVKLMAIYHVRQDNGCWGVMRGREASFGYFRQKADAIQCALDEARSHAPSLVSIELADGRIEGEIRLGPAEPTSA